MIIKEIEAGTIHKPSADFCHALSSDSKILIIWKSLTPLARNEWICWIDSAKKQETKAKRIELACKTLLEGKRRPCCWPGCPHR